MRQKPTLQAGSTEQVVKDTRRATRKQYSAEEKIRIVLDGPRGEYSIAELGRSSRMGGGQPQNTSETIKSACVVILAKAQTLLAADGETK